MILMIPLAFAFAALAVVPHAARAPAPGGPDTLIQRGLELRRAGRSAEALQLFRAAHDRSPSARTLGQMGLVETSLQMWSEADAHLAAALATPGDRWVWQNRAFLAEARKRTSSHVGDLAVLGPPGTRVSVAGKEVGRLPLRAPLRLAQGTVTVSAAAPGKKPFSVRVTVEGASRTAVTVSFDPVTLDAPPPTGPPPAVEAEPRDRRKWIGGALAMTVGAGALVWGISWLQLDGQCAVQAIASRGDRCLTTYDTRTAGLVAASGGAILLVGGAALVTLGLRRTAPPVSIGLAGRFLRLEARF